MKRLGDVSEVVTQEEIILDTSEYLNQVFGIRFEKYGINHKGNSIDQVEYKSVYKDGVEKFYEGVRKNTEYDINAERALKITSNNIFLSEETFEGAYGTLSLNSDFFPGDDYFYTITSIEVEENESFDVSGKIPEKIKQEKYLSMIDGDDITLLQSQGRIIEIQEGTFKKVSGVIVENEGFNSKGVARRVTENVYSFDEDGNMFFSDGTQAINYIEEGRIFRSDQFLFSMTLKDGITIGGGKEDYDISSRKVIRKDFAFNELGYKTDISTMIYKLIEGLDGFSDDAIINEQGLNDFSMFYIDDKVLAFTTSQTNFPELDRGFDFVNNNLHILDINPEFKVVSGTLEEFSHFNSRGEADRSNRFNYVVEDGSILYVDGEISNKLEYDLSGKVLHSLVAQIKFSPSENNDQELVSGFDYSIKNVLETRTIYYPDGNIYKVTVDKWDNLEEGSVLISEDRTGDLSGSKYNISRVDVSTGELTLGKVTLNETLNFRGLVTQGREFSYIWLDGGIAKNYYNSLYLEKS